MKRYQFQPWYIKAYRQVRHRPKWVIVAMAVCIWWLLTGCQVYSHMLYDPKKKSRWQTPLMLWKWSNVRASIDMNHCWYIEELIEQAKKRSEAL